MSLTRSSLLTAALLVAAVPAAAQQQAATLETIPAELYLADSSLRVVNLYKLQGEILLDSAQPPDTAIARLVERVYTPYTAFWNGYLGDEDAFREWSAQLLQPAHPIHSRLDSIAAVGIDRLFTDGVAWIESTTGRRPHGTWYLVFGPGWTDMGGLGGIGMVADFTRLVPDSGAIASLLPHELAHQVHGASPGRAADPDSGTVLERIVSEGFASYVAWVYGGGRHTPAEALLYTPAEWNWAVAHERELFAAVEPILASRERDHLNLVASRNDQILPGAPGAGGYFLGFRIVQAYVARHGRESWKQIFDLPVAEVLTSSQAATDGASLSPSPSRASPSGR